MGKRPTRAVPRVRGKRGDDDDVAMRRGYRPGTSMSESGTATFGRFPSKVEQRSREPTDGSYDGASSVRWMSTQTTQDSPEDKPTRLEMVTQTLPVATET
jgi:hypothetical protein